MKILANFLSIALTSLVLCVNSNQTELEISDDDSDKYKATSFEYHEDFTTEQTCENGSFVCLRKCCKENFVWNYGDCVFRNSSNLDTSSISLDHHVPKDYKFKFLTGMLSCDYFNIDPSKEAHFIDAHGNLFLLKVKATYNHSLYCFEYWELAKQVVGLACIETIPENVVINRVLKNIGRIISMPFLLLTFLVYACLPDRNLHGKSLMCYVISLFGAYGFMAYIQLNTTTIADEVCKSVGLLCYYLYMASFLWMNVISMDIWWYFSGLPGFSEHKKAGEHNRFLFYSLYAWGVPFLLFGVVAALVFIPKISPNEWYHPRIGQGMCWFHNDIPMLIYFYAPMAMILISNMIFFGIIIYKMKQVNRETSDENKKHSVIVYIKLMLAMGLNFSMDVISWLVNWQVKEVPLETWYITDFFNALYGVFIFFIFVFKKKIFKQLKERYYSIFEKPQLTEVVPQTQLSTTGSSLSNTPVTMTDLKPMTMTDDLGVVITQII